MLSLLLTIVFILLLAGILLWGVMALPMIDGTIKQMIKVGVIVIAALWLIIVVFGHFGAKIPG